MIIKSPENSLGQQNLVKSKIRNFFFVTVLPTVGKKPEYDSTFFIDGLDCPKREMVLFFVSSLDFKMDVNLLSINYTMN